ncbi:hypothetical protein A2U01_0067676 [Trifolium medium]|uniref:Uncharacterized protein n=1 Tax=Trifolium medium TaxID=97028 RepID=A0A392SF02_9FABA|nr:hypothetical protein [Trifolium medium]
MVAGCKIFMRAEDIPREGQDSGGTWIRSGVLNERVQGWREQHGG